jgi:hypothetical protein
VSEPGGHAGELWVWGESQLPRLAMVKAGDRKLVPDRLFPRLYSIAGKRSVCHQPLPALGKFSLAMAA